MSVSRAARLFVFVVCALLAHLAIASSAIVGFVNVKGPDAPVGPIQGATVMVSNPATPKQILAVAQTDAFGFYSISVPAGTYRVDFSKTGFLKGTMSSYTLPDAETVLLNADLVPSLTGNEVAKNNVKDETAYTIHNPNNFTVHYGWQLPQHHVSGTGNAPPGDSVIDPNQWPHSENISLFVDGSQVQKETTTVVPPPYQVGNLTGVVKNSAGSFLGGVLIVLTDSGNNQVGSTFSLSDGSYIFHNLPAGNYSLAYSLTGYISASQSVSEAAGGTQAPVETLSPVPPPPTAVLNINVTTQDAGNPPVPNATVTISYSNGAPPVTAYTDGNGFVQVTNQPVGVSATINAFASDGSNRQALVSTSGFVAGPNAVSVVLPALPRGAISGTVTDASNGGGLGNVLVVVLDANNNAVASTNTGPDGTYSVGNLIAGTYSMTFSLANYGTVSTGGVIVQPGATAAQNESLVSTLASVTVTVIDGNNGLPSARSEVQLQYVDGTNTPQVFVDPSGMAMFDSQPSGLGVKIVVTAQDLTNRTAEQFVAGGFAPGNNSYTLTLPQSLGTIEGTIIDSSTQKPLGGVTVTVKDSVTGKLYTATSAPDGTYAVAQLPASKYTVTFSLTGYNDFTNSAPLDPGVTFQDSVSLVPVAAQTAVVQITVRDQTTGAGVPGVSVTLQYSDGHTSGPATSDLGGQALFSKEVPGVPGTVRGTTTDGRSASQPFTGWTAGITNSLTLPYPSTSANLGSIAGTTLDSSTGIALAGVSVTVLDGRGNPVASATTDGRGNFSVAVGQGTYNVTFSLSGYQVKTIPINVTAGLTANLGPIPMSPLATAGKATVDVTVIDGTTSQPVAGASVTIAYTPAAPGIPTLVTNGSGFVEFTNQPAGVAALVTANSTDGRTVSANFPSGFTANQTSTVQLTLPAVSAILSGTVIDATSLAPLSGVKVAAADQSGKQVGSAVTDKSGSFTITVGATGTYNLTLSLAGYQTATTSAKTGAPVFVSMKPGSTPTADVAVSVVDGTNTLIQGATVTITYADGSPSVTGGTGLSGVANFTAQPAGTQATITASGAGMTGTLTTTFVSGQNNVTVVLQPGVGGLTGTVMDSVTKAPILASVTVIDWNGIVVATYITKSDGLYTVGNLVPGTYTLDVTAKGYNEVRLTVPVASGPATVQNVAMTAAAPPQAATVNVTVVDTNNSPVANATVQIAYVDGTNSASTNTDGNGFVSFSNQKVNVGATITARANDGSGNTVSVIVKSGFVSGVNVELLTMQATVPPTISGRVTDRSTGKAIAGATISLLTGPNAVVTTATSQPDGTYLLSGFGAGSYNVSCSAVGYASTGQPIVVSNGPYSVNFALVSSVGMFAGTVTDGNGAALGAVSVTIADANSNVVGSGMTDASGQYAIGNIPVGPYVITFSKSGYQTVSQNAYLMSPSTYTVNATLTVVANPSDATVTVTVTAIGNPAVGAIVTIDYGANNPPSGPPTFQTDSSGQVIFSNQLVGVLATVSVVLSDGTVLPVQTVNGFASGNSAPSNNLAFAY